MALKLLERHLRKDQDALLVVTHSDGLTGAELRAKLLTAGLRITKFSESFFNDDHKRITWCDVRWRTVREQTKMPAVVEDLANNPGVSQLQWKP
jgi:hypothetical protein